MQIDFIWEISSGLISIFYPKCLLLFTIFFFLLPDIQNTWAQMIRYTCLNLWTTVLLSTFVGREATCIDLDCEGSVHFCKVWTLRAASSEVVPAAKWFSRPYGTCLQRRKVRSLAWMKVPIAHLRITCQSSKCTFTNNRSSVENILKQKCHIS